MADLHLLSGLNKSIKLHVSGVSTGHFPRERVVPQTNFPHAYPSDQLTVASPSAALFPVPRILSFSLAHPQCRRGFSTHFIFVTPCPLCQNFLLGLNLPHCVFQRPSLIPVGTSILNSRTMVFSSFSLKTLSSNKNFNRKTQNIKQKSQSFADLTGVESRNPAQPIYAVSSLKDCRVGGWGHKRECPRAWELGCHSKPCFLSWQTAFPLSRPIVYHLSFLIISWTHPFSASLALSFKPPSYSGPDAGVGHSPRSTCECVKVFWWSEYTSGHSAGICWAKARTERG